MADEENRKFFSEDNNYEYFIMYVLYRLFGKQTKYLNSTSKIKIHYKDSIAAFYTKFILEIFKFSSGIIDYCSSEVTKQKLVTWLVLEGAIASKLQPIDMWKNDWAVKFNIPEEENDHLTSSTKSSDFINLGFANKTNPSEVPTKDSTKDSKKQSVVFESSQNSNFEEGKKSKAPTEWSSI